MNIYTAKEEAGRPIDAVSTPAEAGSKAWRHPRLNSKTRLRGNKCGSLFDPLPVQLSKYKYR